MIVAAGLVAARFVHFAALTFIFGAGWAPTYADLRPVADRLRGLRRLAAWLALASAIGWFVFAVGSMVGSLSGAFAPAALIASVRDMTFGRVSAIRMVGCALLIILVSSPVQDRLERPAWLLAGALLASLALTGHAQEEEGWALAAHGVADALHLLAAGLWLGALGVFVLLLTGPALSDEESGRRALSRFSTTGIVSVLILVATGLVNAVFLVGAPTALVSTPYGRVLTIKLLLFLAMVGLAAFNRRDLRSGAVSMRTLRRRVVVEQAMGAGVLLAVAILGTMPPAIMAGMG
ncbi:MAG: copper homeostasis membrane protein CopD [Caulobacteraceae bacterium]